MMSLPAIVVVHNRYQESGGEDTVFEQEAALLEGHGHRVVRVILSNDEVPGMSAAQLGGALYWNRSAARQIRDAVVENGASVAHFHNTFPLVSPAGYYAARSGGAAVVQTLHNYRLICPGTLLMRDGKPCEACVGSAVAWRGAVHGCYRQSRIQSAAAGSMVAAHRALGTWRKRVDAYIALTDFARGRFVAGGLPEERIHVRPNFLGYDPGTGDHAGGYALFVGRVTEQKGIATLLKAWSRIGEEIPLHIIGRGDLSAEDFPAASGVRWLGQMPRREVLEAMREARVLVLPSISYENFPMTVVEAFATGLPVIASKIGSLPEIVEHGVTGAVFEPGSPEGLEAAVRWLWDDPDRLRSMGSAARAAFDGSYSADRAYTSLIDVYEGARRAFEDAQRA